MNTNDKLAEAEKVIENLRAQLNFGFSMTGPNCKGLCVYGSKESIRAIKHLLLERHTSVPAPAVEAPTGTPPRAWTEQERQDAQDAMRKIVDSELRLIDERDHAHDIIDKLCDAVLGPDRKEWSSAYFFENAVEDVEEEIARLKKQAPPAAGAKVWQPIATAPKNGLGILALLPESNFPVGIRHQDGGWHVAWDGHRLGDHDQPEYWMHIPDLDATNPPATQGDAREWTDHAIGTCMGEWNRALKSGKLPSEAWRIALNAAIAAQAGGEG